MALAITAKSQEVEHWSHKLRRISKINLLRTKSMLKESSTSLGTWSGESDKCYQVNCDGFNNMVFSEFSVVQNAMKHISRMDMDEGAFCEMPE